MNNQVDFMVLWSPNGDAHRIEGSDSAHARAEADRLAALNPGTTFVVLQPAYSTVTQRGGAAKASELYGDKKWA